MKRTILILSGLLIFASARLVAATVNTLNWSAQKERGVYGYIVYRATGQDDSFLRLNPKILRVSPEGNYRFVDDNVIAGQTYRYVIYSVGTNGSKQPLSPIVEKTAGGAGVKAGI